ncbi:glycoside hydrolase family 47 protein [Panaeolus papilionaceus]|nr:glycoside hydrolase family 47 protein [Panaeolus papilionaceus]
MPKTNLLSVLFPETSLVEVDDEPGPAEAVDIVVDVEKRDAIVGAFKRYSWLLPEKYAMGSDEYHPITKKGSNFSTLGGIGYTVIDAIDTMQIMGLEKEYKTARNWIATKQSFDRDNNYNTFETTIRVLGGLLSAYHLSGGDSLFLKKAQDLADRMMPVFETPSGLPYSMANLGLRKAVDDPHVPYLVSTAEATTLQLEFKYLSKLTGNKKYWEKADKVMDVVRKAERPKGLAPIHMDARTGTFSPNAEIRLGSRGDSFYEYLLKQYLLTKRTEPKFREFYEETMTAIHENLVQRGLSKNHVYIAELHPERKADGTMDWKLNHKQDHLVCFLAGSLMLGATTTGATVNRPSIPPKASELTATGLRDWQLGEELLQTCLHTYETATGLSPEIAHFFHDKKKWRHPKRDWYVSGNDFPGNPSYDARYILRPETVESLFIAYRLTGDNKYRDAGWKIFQSIEEYCKIEDGGYASILNTDHVRTIKMDKMETFFLSETLKYLYLLFTDSSVIPLNKYVFNTEAHPLPVFTPPKL